jgi:2-amino-4-hydroxy-6-hydroxymethyldihydropteridine diphosphokinase
MAGQQASVNTRVLIAIGSNQGDSVAVVRAAMNRLATFARGALVRSSLWRTTPVDCPPGSNDFVNAVVAFEPLDTLAPERLLDSLKDIERDFGRTENAVRHAPRELDLDLLVFGEARRSSADFTLPHPRATNRRFVLVPAAEVAPDLVWPGIGRTVRELLASLDSNERVELLHDQVVASDGSSEGRVAEKGRK